MQAQTRSPHDLIAEYCGELTWDQRLMADYMIDMANSFLGVARVDLGTGERWYPLVETDGQAQYVVDEVGNLVECTPVDKIDLYPHKYV